MQNNAIPIKRGSQAALAKLYLHLLNAALNEAAASTEPQGREDGLSMRNQALLKVPGAQAHSLTVHWELSSARKTGAPTRG
jgi:hypothetical protein